MGVPQTRERVFFISTRNDLTLSKLKLEFKEPPISINEAWLGINSLGKDVSSSSMVKYWEYTRPGEPMSKYHPKGSLFGQIKLNPKLPSPTVTSKEYQLWDWRSPNLLSPIQVSRLQTFPDDFNFLNHKSKYLCGMSVPPYMMQRVALEVYKQLL